MSKISAILPQESIMFPDGSKVYLHSLKDYPSYKIIDTGSQYVAVEVNIAHAMHLFSLRGLDFWTEIIEIIGLCQASSSPHARIWNLELYLEADVSILTELVPVGIHGSEKFDENGDSLGQMTFQEWNAGGDQPIAQSNDETKSIIRTNIGSVCVTMEEILIFNQFKTDNPLLNINLLNSIELQSLMGTAAYQTEEI